MAVRPAPPAQLTYWTLPVRDLERAQRFFGDVMGWTFSDPGSAGGCHVLESEPWGGLVPASDVGTGTPDPGAATLAFGVGDIRAAVLRVRELGGTAEEPADSGGHGLWAACTDDQGTRFALFTRAPDAS